MTTTATTTKPTSTASVMAVMACSKRHGDHIARIWHRDPQSPDLWQTFDEDMFRLTAATDELIDPAEVRCTPTRGGRGTRRIRLTAIQLVGLAPGSVVLDAEGEAWQSDDAHLWNVVGEPKLTIHSTILNEAYGPCFLVWEPARP
ncbi:hypothetical protein [Acidipropionibacterium jensenii]|uniref:hypothetical protein n=1 Tax=Acidipropionibacterium jensenii TaxID=1749 RepID=UPI00214B0FED|nr:hypothetical protein [Acidipropionibacterium jensenii]